MSQSHLEPLPGPRVRSLSSRSHARHNDEVVDQASAIQDAFGKVTDPAGIIKTPTGEA